ncbi:YlbE-like protein [Evansella caseinilytica]|uniref:YlbE-like protein n=1 Tax=Evansella caseinilytica TaxID=1503961 RepID=A0A1H3MKQ6_9BACI|nr:YlbE-like family protein [Evansella caseinilytica]SDY77008.1 YlbE-like protein [Evansella caseinilytica]
MRSEVYQHIRNQPELHRFLRYNPRWYRILSRNPFALQQMEREAKVFYGKTFPQRMDRLQNNMNLAMMMLEMMRQFKPN